MTASAGAGSPCWSAWQPPASWSEFLSGQWGARRYGGSRGAAWGALAGGLVGVVAGGAVPVPIVGAVVTSFLGTFVGALVGEALAVRRSPAVRVGVGALVGRAIGVGVKLGLAWVMVVTALGVVVAQAMG